MAKAVPSPPPKWKKEAAAKKGGGGGGNWFSRPATLLSSATLAVVVALSWNRISSFLTNQPDFDLDYTSYFLQNIAPRLPCYAWPLPVPAAKKHNKDTTTSPIKQLLDAFHTLQHPPKHTCRHRRLLLTQFSATNFEGMGSVLKLVQLSLAEAAHYNRTLIWGLDLTFTWENSRDVWQKGIGEDGESLQFSSSRVRIGPNFYDCSQWKGLAGGPYTCFFQPLSSCSLEDISEEELLGLAVKGHLDTERVKLSECAQRGVASYHPPFLNREFAPIFLEPAKRGKPIRYSRHVWAAATAQYAFRLKPEVQAIFDAEREVMYREGGADPNARPAWAFHVRHGDVAALQAIYPNRKVYSFADFMDVAIAKAQALESKRKPPAASLFVASDAVDISTHLSFLSSPENNARWPHQPPPPIFSNDRIRHQHGAHTYTAEGGCLGKTCALPAEVVIMARVEGAKDPVPRSLRIARVLAESIADIYHLSKADWIVTQGSSHFSTFAVILAWARFAEEDPSGWSPKGVAHLMDEKELATGEVQTAFIHGAYNQSVKMDAKNGVSRWSYRTLRFVSGLFEVEGDKDKTGTGHVVPGFYPSHPDYRLRQVNLIPYLPDATFYLEAARWTQSTLPPLIWPGECPLAQKQGQSDQMHLGELINLGADHSNLHHGQSMLCWLEARRIINRNRNLWNKDLVDVLEGNIQALGGKQLFPYSMGSDKVVQFMSSNVGSVPWKAAKD